MDARHVMVLAGGLSHEREVSLRSGSRLAQALRQVGHDVTVRDADDTLLDWVGAHHPDAAIIALHGGRGENGAVQTVLELAGVPFVGTAAHECRLAWDKATAKVLLRRAGFVTPRWVTLSHSSFRDMGAAGLVAAVARELAFPLLLKPHQGGSALGTALVRDPDQLPAALVGSFAYGDVVLVEEYAAGTEVAVTVIEGDDGPVALPAVEIVPPGDIFDYEARYTAGTTTYHTPARLDSELDAAVAELAVAAHRVLGLRDVSRTDVIVTADGRAQFLEVNVSPGLTETSMLPMAVATAGRDLGETYAELAERAIARAADRTAAI
mgnify:CR=1 FL=1